MIKFLFRIIKLLIPIAIIFYFYSGTNSVAGDMFEAGKNIGLQARMKIDMFNFSRQLTRERFLGADFPNDFGVWLNTSFDSIGDVSLDPWDNPFLLETDGDRFTIRSLGPDGIYNSKDDILHSGKAKKGDKF